MSGMLQHANALTPPHSTSRTTPSPANKASPCAPAIYAGPRATPRGVQDIVSPIFARAEAPKRPLMHHVTTVQKRGSRRINMLAITKS